MPLSRPIRSKTETSYDVFARVFQRSIGTCHVYFLRVLIRSSCVVIGQSNYFGFGFTTLKWKLEIPETALEVIVPIQWQNYGKHRSKIKKKIMTSVVVVFVVVVVVVVFKV